MCPLYRASRDATILREAAVPNSVVKQLLCRVVDLGLVEEGLVPLTTSLLHAVSTVLLDMILSTLIREEGNKEHPSSLLFQIIFQSSLPCIYFKSIFLLWYPCHWQKGEVVQCHICMYSCCMARRWSIPVCPYSQKKGAVSGNDIFLHDCPSYCMFKFQGFPNWHPIPELVSSSSGFPWASVSTGRLIIWRMVLLRLIPGRIPWCAP